MITAIIEKDNRFGYFRGIQMQDTNERNVFVKIVRASATNIAGFGLATALVSYLVKNTDIKTPVMILAGLIVFIILVSLSSLLMFLYFTIKNIPETMSNSPGKSFFEVYKFILYALAIRLVEAVICVIYIVHIYHLYF
jgi:NADH:ubiquinone oxidoreductase subunit 6 (subunit J)